MKGSSSLTKLKYGSVTEYSFLKSLLATHAATLECVHLETKYLPVSFLKMLPRLRSLACILNDDLSQLQALPTLDTFAVLDLGVHVFPPGALDFLSQASQLRCVSFPCPWQNPSAPLLALAGSRCARVVETLSLRCASNGDVMELVAASLHQFPSLQSLSLDAVPSDSFLHAVTPAFAPCLTTLTVRPTGCPHAWLHGPAAQDLLARNPRLHLRLGGSRGFLGRCDCRWCMRGWGCHAELMEAAREADSLRAAFASHSRRIGCPSDCFRWPC